MANAFKLLPRLKNGSFFAVVEVGSREVGSDITYTVRMSDGELIRVQRQHLRRRRWYRIAFLQVTNDKKHDCYSSQAFADRRLWFFEIWQEHGLDEALEFSLEDGAEKARRASDRQAQAASTSKQAAESACPADVNVAAAISIAASANAAKTRSCREPRPGILDFMSPEHFEKWYVEVKQERFWA